MRAVSILLLFAMLAGRVTVLAAAKDPPNDGMVYDRVIRKLVNDRDLKTNAIEVTVKDGVVTLRGVIDSEKLRQRAEHVTQKVEGVKKVINELRIRQ
ncbi:MAG TPA: BON domain-containing protein [Bryobacterales bacterium]|nr:BON domain-containing protein [Bryobacterales bacterium]